MGRPLGVNTILVLAAISRGFRYGLDIANRTDLQLAVVYTTLRRLERRRLVQSSWEDAEIALSEARPRRRYYALTADGRAALENGLDHFDRIGVALPLQFGAQGDAS